MKEPNPLNPFVIKLLPYTTNQIDVRFVSDEVVRKLEYYKPTEPDYMQGPNPDGAML